jgi:hypothetical protein
LIRQSKLNFQWSYPILFRPGSYTYAFYVDIYDTIYEMDEEYFDPYEDYNNNLIFGNTVTVVGSDPLHFTGLIDNMMLRAGDTRNQIPECI